MNVTRAHIKCEAHQYLQRSSDFLWQSMAVQFNNCHHLHVRVVQGSVANDVIVAQLPAAVVLPLAWCGVVMMAVLFLSVNVKRLF